MSKSKGWRCFHCDAYIISKEEALQHFGPNEISYTACQIDIEKYRQMEELHLQNIHEDTVRDRIIYAMHAQHLIDLRCEEEKGYARGLADGQKKEQTSMPMIPLSEMVERIARNLYKENQDTNTCKWEDLNEIEIEFWIKIANFTIAAGGEIPQDILNAWKEHHIKRAGNARP